MSTIQLESMSSDEETVPLEENIPHVDAQPIETIEHNDQRIEENRRHASEHDSIEYNQISISAKICQLYKIAFPHVLMIVLLICYILTGAKLIQYFEEENEIKIKEQNRLEITTLRQDFRDNIFKLLNTKNLDNKALEIIEEEYFQTLTKQTLKSSGSTSDNYRFLLNNTHERKLWNYQNSVFFAITFLTTIGNQHLIPSTDIGRIVCICFFFFGIPLYRIVIDDIGKILLHCLPGTIKEGCSYIKNRLNRRVTDITSHGIVVIFRRIEIDTHRWHPWCVFAKYLIALFVYVAFGSWMFQLLGGRGFVYAVFGIISSMSTIGFYGSLPPEQDPQTFFLLLLYIVLGIVLSYSYIDLTTTYLKAYLSRLHYYSKAKRILKYIF